MPKYSEAYVAREMKGRRAIFLDFEDSIVSRKRYVWEALKALRKQPEKVERMKDVYRLAKGRNAVKQDENRAFDILNVVSGLPYSLSDYFGKKLAEHIRKPVLELMMLYDEIDMRALVTRDDIGTVLPTIEKMENMGIGLGKYIANAAEVTIDGTMTGRLDGSVAYGVEGWDGRCILTPEDKMNAIDAIRRSYGLELADIAYITDNDPGEGSARAYIVGGGGTVLEAKKLPRMGHGRPKSK